MLIIWRGLGILVPVIALLSMVACQVIVNAIYNNEYYQTHSWAQGVSLCITAVLVGWFGCVVNRKKEGEDDLPSHSLFFIPIEYWSIIIFAFAILGTLNPNQEHDNNPGSITTSKVNYKNISEQNHKDNRNNSNKTTSKLNDKYVAELSTTYLETPEINDKYIADFSKVFKKENEKYKKYKYGVLKVSAVNKEKVQLIISNFSYATKYEAEKDIVEKKDNLESYYSKKYTVIKRKILMKFKSQDIIIYAHRD